MDENSKDILDKIEEYQSELTFLSFQIKWMIVARIVNIIILIVFIYSFLQYSDGHWGILPSIASLILYMISLIFTGLGGSRGAQNTTMRKIGPMRRRKKRLEALIERHQSWLQ
ncbi:hypothetical protein BAU15_07550 [Enterococcus sp. JM4C]|uniref:hypothetical protein n=1 Tax=Candidatus Enterococcus huntleyi TaxID=1857217 RepID=UPI00137997DE|nr:hypothetical protein [Enterococcus sp. JM4C]KAF1297557.1 hypothetical protein BAU15_07550 [Enterococcus sp. JM4C]